MNSLYEEKAFDKIQYAFIINSSGKTMDKNGILENSRDDYIKSKANSKLMERNLKQFH